jgi:4a-hydroxytetrahydrobiopterin dehydratase
MVRTEQTDSHRPVTPTDFHHAEGLDAWRVLGDGAAAFFRTASFAESVRFVAAMGEIDAIDRHPPAVDVRAGGVTVRVVTASDEQFGMTEADVDIAQRVSAVAREHGLPPDPAQLQHLLVIPGAPSGVEIRPFWRAVLGYVPRPDSPDDDLVDRGDRGPGFWFESMDEARGDGGGAIHVAIWLPLEEAEARVAAAIAAGGRLVRDDFAPSWWTLADAAGNEADVATVADRE